MPPNAQSQCRCLQPRKIPKPSPPSFRDVIGKMRRPRFKEALDSTLTFCARAALVSTGVLPTEMLPPDTMDKVTVAKLEAVRRQTPRYLFRLWSNGAGTETPSGGKVGLNTTSAITPYAFSDGGGGGHKSVYDMSTTEFTGMVRRHLRVCSHISTEFSSWSASLSYVLFGCPGIGSGNVNLSRRDQDAMHIAVIDVEALWESNEVFYVPLLDFLSPGNMNYAHEYLVHGVVTGPWYKAIPYSATTRISELQVSPDWHFDNDSITPVRLAEYDIRWARKFGELFGDHFALPMMLAVLCCTKRDPDLWMLGISDADLKLLLDGMKGLRIPESWKKPHPITGHTISCKNFSDTRQMTTLLRTLVRHFRSEGFPDDDVGGGESGSRERLSFELGHEDTINLSTGGESGGNMIDGNIGATTTHADQTYVDVELDPDLKEVYRTLFGLSMPRRDGSSQTSNGRVQSTSDDSQTPEDVQLDPDLEEVYRTLFGLNLPVSDGSTQTTNDRIQSTSSPT